MGKCYSLTNKDNKRADSDFYQTPTSLVNEYFKYKLEMLQGKTILDPCCGENAIGKALHSLDPTLNIVEKDLRYGEDFFNETNHYDIIIANTPFQKSTNWIEKAYEVADTIFFILPLSHLQGNERYQKDTYRYLKDVAIFTRFVMYENEIRPDGLFNCGMMATGWFYFSKDKDKVKEKPTLSWVDVQEYVLTSAVKKKDIRECLTFGQVSVENIFRKTKCITRKEIASEIKSLAKKDLITSET